MSVLQDYTNVFNMLLDRTVSRPSDFFAFQSRFDLDCAMDTFAVASTTRINTSKDACGGSN